MKKKIIVWGATGHARVLFSILQENNFYLLAFIDVNKKISPSVEGYPIFYDEVSLLKNCKLAPRETLYFSTAIGGDKGMERIKIHRRLTHRGLIPVKLIHSSAWVAKTALLGDGVQVLAMAAVSEMAKIGMQTIINTNASVDHETIIGKGCHIMPGATIAGCAKIGDFSTIGSNATVLPRIKIGVGAIVGAGAVVTKDVPNNTVVLGVPARVHKNLTEKIHE